MAYFDGIDYLKGVSTGTDLPRFGRSGYSFCAPHVLADQMKYVTHVLADQKKYATHELMKSRAAGGR